MRVVWPEEFVKVQPRCRPWRCTFAERLWEDCGNRSERLHAYKETLLPSGPGQLAVSRGACESASNGVCVVPANDPITEGFATPIVDRLHRSNGSIPALSTSPRAQIYAIPRAAAMPKEPRRMTET